MEMLSDIPKPPFQEVRGPGECHLNFISKTLWGTVTFILQQKS